MDVTDTITYKTTECLKISHLLSRIADKWSVLIIMELYNGPRRFSELKREIDGVSQRMLTLTLRNLERDGLVERIVTPSIPPRVDYKLTPMGVSLSEPIRALGMWAFQNLAQIDEAQVRYERANAVASWPHQKKA